MRESERQHVRRPSGDDVAALPSADAILTIAGLSAHCRSTSTPGPPGPKRDDSKPRTRLTSVVLARAMALAGLRLDRHNNPQNLARETREPGCGRALCIAPPIKQLQSGRESGGAPFCPRRTRTRPDEED